MLNPFISYPDFKTKYSIGLIELGQQPDHKIPIKIQLLQE